MRGWLSAMLAATALGCVQIEIESISNSGKITDYMTSGDEIKMQFGTSPVSYYQVEKDFNKSESMALPAGAISFPCLSDDTLWIQMTEIDTFRNDKMTVVLDCRYFQTTPG
jgi:hypothetical protein